MLGKYKHNHDELRYRNCWVTYDQRNYWLFLDFNKIYQKAVESNIEIQDAGYIMGHLSLFESGVFEIPIKYHSTSNKYKCGHCGYKIRLADKAYRAGYTARDSSAIRATMEMKNGRCWLSVALRLGSSSDPHNVLSSIHRLLHHANLKLTHYEWRPRIQA